MHVLAAVASALGAAVSFAFGNLLQMYAARRADSPNRLNLGLLQRLLRDRLWLGGLVACVVGFGLQAVALYLAPVVVVQPLIATELLFALPAAAAISRHRFGRRETLGVVLVAGGVAAFEVVGRPSGDATFASGGRWLAVSFAAAALVGLLAVSAERLHHRPMLRASGLAVAAGICFGMLAVLTRTVGHEFSERGLGSLVTLEPYLLVAFAIIGLLMTQTALRIAPISISLPLIDVFEPLSACAIAVLALREQVGAGTSAALGTGLSALAIVAGIGLLDSSGVVQTVQRDLAREASETHPRHARQRSLEAHS